MGCNSSRQSSRIARRREPVQVFLEAEDEHREDGQEDGGEVLAMDSRANTRGQRDEDRKLNLFLPDILEGGSTVEYTAKPELSVVSYLAYTGEDEQSQEVEIKNLDTESVFFKVKTTHPKLFAVKPNRGLIGPESSVSVQVRYKAAPNIKVHFEKIKLMVQGVKLDLPGHDFLPQEMWSGIPGDCVSVNIIKIDFETEEDVDFTKFKSINMTMSSEAKPWWK